ncbi:unnamed protein product [Schistosoma rodhaini]|uniref:Protein zwilch homolog n=1 Tax=Schistosoma rodhaini TaxID=6188 RepID=A0AA85EM54_9TREM|nr:unnamed protein product [Schistosoma rodhaini]CAH8680069.1 unnamed protein product [Schistosoma rodhaini]
MLSFVEQEFGVVCTKIVHSPCDGQINCDTEDECLNSSDRFTETSSRCDDFEGNPLKIEKIANLSIESSFTDSQKESVKPRSRFFDFRGLKPLENKPLGGYIDNVLYFVREKGEQFIGLFPKTKTSKRILRISSEFNVDVNHSIKELSQGSMLSFPEFVCTFECMYKLSHGIFRARYETCEDEVLSPPPSFVSGELTVNITPYKSNKLISNLLEEIQILKDLYRAYECDSPVWLANSVVNCEQVKAEFPNIFKSVKLNKVDRPDGRACGVIFNHLLSERKLDSSEAIWNAVKGSPNKLTFRTCVENAFEYLIDKSELIHLASHNRTQLAWRLRHLHDSTETYGQNPYGLFNYGIETLIEIGLHKVINDCVYLLESMIPDSSTFFESDRQSGWSLESQWDVLHNLYISVSFLVCLGSMISKSSLISELRKIMAQKSQKNEWKSALYEPDNKPFCMTHSFSLLVSELVVPVSELPPDLWIMRIDAKNPVPTSIRIIYELVKKDGLEQYACHKLRMVDSYWPNIS